MLHMDVSMKKPRYIIKFSVSQADQNSDVVRGDPCNRFQGSLLRV